MIRRTATAWRWLPLLLLAAPAGANELHMDPAGRDLRVALAVPQAVWVPGREVVVEATLTNTGPVPFRVDTFGELNAVYEGKKRTTILVSCWTLSWGPQAIEAGPVRGRALLHADQFALLQPGQSYTRRLTLTVPPLPGGRRQVQLTYTPRAASPSFSFPDHWLDQQAIREPMWIGMARSEPVPVDVAVQ